MTTNNNVEVSVSIKATINVTEQMKEKIKENNPIAYEEFKHDDESLAIMAMYMLMDMILPKEFQFGNELITGISTHELV